MMKQSNWITFLSKDTSVKNFREDPISRYYVKLLTNRQTDRDRDRQRQTDRQTDRQKDRQTDRQTEVR